MTDTDHRIALFLPNLGGGGAERVMLNLACGFVEQGYPTDLVLSTADGEYLSELDERVRLVDLGASRVVTSLPAFVRYLVRERPAAVLSTQAHSNVVALLGAAWPGVHTRVVVRDTESPVGATPRRKTLNARVAAWFARLLYRKADAIVAVCEDMKQQIADDRAVSADDVTVVYNPVRTTHIKARAAEPTGHPWFDDESVPIVLSIGRLDEQKDFPSLLTAFAKLRASHPARLVILGEGELRAELEALAAELGIAEDVYLPGFVTNPYAYLSRASVFAMSSLWEGLPNVLLEALVLGTPIVSTDCETGPREILRHGRDGILVPISDPDALAEGLRKILSAGTPEPVSAESVARFDMASVVRQYAELMLPRQAGRAARGGTVEAGGSRLS